MSDLIETVALAINAVGPNYDSLGRASDPGSFDLAETALRAIEAAGYRIMPVKLTEDMTGALSVGIYDDAPNQQIWEAMLAAAPKVVP